MADFQESSTNLVFITAFSKKSWKNINVENSLDGNYFSFSMFSIMFFYKHILFSSASCSSSDVIAFLQRFQWQHKSNFHHKSKNTFNIIIFFLKFTLNKVLQMQKNPLQNTKKYNFSIDTKSDGFHGDVIIQMKYLEKCSFYFRNNMILIE